MKMRIKKAKKGIIKSSVVPLERPKDVSFFDYFLNNL